MKYMLKLFLSILCAGHFINQSLLAMEYKYVTIDSEQSNIAYSGKDFYTIMPPENLDEFLAEQNTSIDGLAQDALCAYKVIAQAAHYSLFDVVIYLLNNPGIQSCL